uniref:Uncharacterized protein n=1 Tax=Rhizophora mucronata TaxID=61149 RepID=A0A2P2Q1U1_RHIMU
MMCTICRTRTK